VSKVDRSNSLVHLSAFAYASGHWMSNHSMDPKDPKCNLCNSSHMVLNRIPLY